MGLRMNDFSAHQVQRACPVCRHSAATPLHRNTLVPVAGIDLSYQVARCQKCGFHFADRLPATDSYQSYYSTLSKYDLQGPCSALDRQRVAAAVHLCGLRQLDSQARILDLGCGSGAFLAALRGAGWVNLTGLDPAPKAAAAAQHLYDLDCIKQGTIANAPEIVDLGQVDLLCLLAVLEHLPELYRDFSHLCSHLRPGAQLLIEVPALELFDADQGEPFGELSLEHIQYFSRASLHNLLGSLGLRLLQTEWLELPELGSGSLFAWAEVPWVRVSNFVAESEHSASLVFDAYLQGSGKRMRAVLSKVPDHPFILYGAGSHSARLVPAMSSDQQNNLLALFDANPNLQGQPWGRWQIQAPAALAAYPGVPLLLSSYRSERAMAATLRQQCGNPLLPLYMPAHEL